MRVIEVISAKELLSEIYNNKNLSTRVSYKLFVMINKLDSVLGFYEDGRRKIFEKFGEQNGDNLVIPNDRMDEAQKEINELMEIEVEDAPEKVDISLDIDLGVSPADIGLLIPFINFVE